MHFSQAKFRRKCEKRDGWPFTNGYFGAKRVKRQRRHQTQFRPSKAVIFHFVQQIAFGVTLRENQVISNDQPKRMISNEQ